MFGKEKREYEVNGFHFENVDEIYYLKRILENQNEILNTLKSVDNNIVKYFGEEHEPRERELNEKIRDANFSKEQFEVLKEAIAYTRENHSKKEDICNITNLPCCYCQSVCGSRKNK